MSREKLETEQAGVFSDAETVANLKGLVLRGGAVKLASQAVKFALRVGGLVVMARLLTPQDFGVFAMIATFTGFLQEFNSTNLTMPTVQKERITHAQISFLFWVSAGLGLALALITAAAGPAIAWFYGDPRLTRVALGIAPMFVLGGLATQHQAILQRRMRLVAIELSGVAAQSLGMVVMVVSAWRGAGYWSLVLNVLAMAAANVVFFWSLSGWRPGLPRRDAGVRELLAFGGNLSGNEFFGYVQRTLDKVLIGRTWGAQVLGFYVKAIGLITLSLTQLVIPIGYVVVPALSRLQSDVARYRVYYSKTVGATFFLTMPLVAFICIDPAPIVLTALGRQWLPVVPIFLALAPAAAASTLTVSYVWVCLSLGRGKRLARASFFMAAGSSAAFLGGLAWGAVGVASAYSAVYCALIVPILAYGLKDSPIRPRDVWSIAWRPAAAATAAVLLSLAARSLFPHAGVPAVRLAGDFALFALGYAGAWLALPGGLPFLRDIASSAARAIR